MYMVKKRDNNALMLLGEILKKYECSEREGYYRPPCQTVSKANSLIGQGMFSSELSRLARTIALMLIQFTRFSI
ncbi:hypothetical protein GWI33_018611 [Rhynchophorus ferrugineus]|uniref:Uncharacterized protein n=1 Tax=Rhynchophorus ferrugineus TaxID=354439 RepID=A0A834HW07_RHYFE|nr:hypothetical protein GWI33_018611 [Rhynchophorus ferrugineus]